MRKRFYKLERIDDPVPEAYLVDPSGRLVWLQRLAHKVLKRWGMHAMARSSVAREIEVPGAHEIAQGLADEITARIAWGVRREELVIIVGAEAYQGLQLALAGEARLMSDDRRIFGVPVYVSDWFDGTIVLPKRALQ